MKTLCKALLFAALGAPAVAIEPQDMGAKEAFIFLLTNARINLPSNQDGYMIDVNNDLRFDEPTSNTAYFEVTVDDPCKPTLTQYDRARPDDAHRIVFDMSHFEGIVPAKEDGRKGYWLRLGGDCPVEWKGKCAVVEQTQFVNFYELMYGVEPPYLEPLPRWYWEDLDEAAWLYRTQHCPQ